MSRYEALRAAESAFSRRLCGMSPIGESAYQGPFDFMPAVNAASLPRNASPDEHKKAWAAFRDLFAQEWRDHGRRD